MILLNLAMSPILSFTSSVSGLWMYWNAYAAKVECEFSLGFIRPRCSAVACAISLILDYPAIRFTASIRESIWSIVFTPLEN